jgi:type II secretory pathway pseudopilin PulG
LALVSSSLGSLSPGVSPAATKKVSAFSLNKVLVAIILLIIVAVAVYPNAARLYNAAQTTAAAGELHTVQMAVSMAISEANSAGFSSETLAGSGSLTLDKSHDIAVGNSTVGAFLKGGIAKLRGSYNLDSRGAASQTNYP